MEGLWKVHTWGLQSPGLKKIIPNGEPHICFYVCFFENKQKEYKKTGI